jgi:hypothetical protein
MLKCVLGFTVYDLVLNYVPVGERNKKPMYSCNGVPC